MRQSIVVVGLLPAQRRKLERIFSGAARLRFVESRGKLARIPVGDHCVLLIKFVKHAWTDEAFRVFPRERVHYLRGGPTELERFLKNLLQESRA